MVNNLKPKLRELGVDPDSIKPSRTRKKTQVTGKETKLNPHRIFMSVCLKEGKGMNTCNAEWRAKKQEATPVG